ncbi:DUF2441 domain-containing protein [Fluoribacter gormanii]|uniref:DUF2441 domain-containing protein n=1 Tax=Fluoribacter gormanii TaxID=464 RepID=UPI002243D4A7|nr:DUF2441 domain-containing protein [Fluoribacter gormanii]MCW8472291.1 DUF2441 domain-containing protein [Fluoribacter gormanii]
MGILEKNYYHIAPILLEPGSIIIPGNYGRIINLTGINHQLYSREMLLEYVRVKNFNHKPSRFSSCFACIDLDEAKFYRSLQHPTSLIYEVKIINTSTKFHIGCYNMLPSVNCSGVPGNPEAVANKYWNGSIIKVQGHENYNCNELVVESSLKIISKIDN